MQVLEQKYNISVQNEILCLPTHGSFAKLTNAINIA